MTIARWTGNPRPGVPTLDLYTGFEGWPEVWVEYRRDERVVEAVHAWEGYFSQAIEAAVPEGPTWTGLLLQYHVDMDYIDEFWCDTRPEHTLRVLASARGAGTQLWEETLTFLDAYAELLRSALANGGEIWLLVE
jgi:hypothetical protein